MNIRLATLDDVPIISAMYREFFAEISTMQPRYYRAADEKGEYPMQSIKSDKSDIFIAESHGNIAGFAHVSEDKTLPYDAIVQYKFAVCMELFVSPIYRKQGVATALMNAIKDWAKTRKLEYVELSVLIENENAIHLYEENGFQAVRQIMRCGL